MNSGVILIKVDSSSVNEVRCSPKNFTLFSIPTAFKLKPFETIQFFHKPPEVHD